MVEEQFRKLLEEGEGLERRIRAGEMQRAQAVLAYSDHMERTLHALGCLEGLPMGTDPEEVARTRAAFENQMVQTLMVHRAILSTWNETVDEIGLPPDIAAIRPCQGE